MGSTRKPESVMVTIRNRKNNTSKSVTLYDTSIEEVYEKIKRLFSEK